MYGVYCHVVLFWLYFPRKNPITSGSSAKNALQLKASYGSAPFSIDTIYYDYRADFEEFSTCGAVEPVGARQWKFSQVSSPLNIYTACL